MNISSKTTSAQFPHRHLSIRVPWHDNGWIGGICKAPSSNVACLILPNVREKKHDEQEVALAGKLIKELPKEQWPPCVTESATFMAPFEFTRNVEHPYQGFSSLHQNLLPTNFRNPPYSAAAIPFRRMNSQFAWELAKEQDLNVDQGREPVGENYLKNWIQNHENQKEILDSFFNAIKLDTSLCFFYAKQTPLVDDERRVIVGVGRVKHVGSAVEYNCKEKDKFRSYIWERTVQHSIRPGFSDGFLLPYKQILEIASQDQTIDPADFVAFAPNDRRIEFSYGTEHITHDAAIASLVACRGAIEKARSLVTGRWDIVLDWIDDRLADLWKLRGPFPGLGSALRAFGLECGSSLAYELSDRLSENEDPWPLIHQIFNEPSKNLPKQLASYITPTMQKKWIEITQNKPHRLSLLKLLARFEINSEQALRFYSLEQREKAGIKCTDEELLGNPYLIYEQDRTSFEGISIFTVDRGLFPDPIVRETHPLPEPSRLEGQFDPRRVRALVVTTLEDGATQGHTLLPRNQVVLSINDLGIEPKCPVDGDLLDVISNDLSSEVVLCELEDHTPAYQLVRFARIKELISSMVQKRLKGKRLSIEVDWQQKLDEKLVGPVDEKEEQARKEKAAALKELAESRISVLIGPAGTGKTTLLSILCSEPTIARNGILLLAPTGKARVQLLRSTNIQAQTLAQFLYKHGRYDGATAIYHLSDVEKVDVGKTMIIDEASMLTEEQLGAVLDAIKGVERLILVGDPSQLPPIGAGRPFVDIVKQLSPDTFETLDIRVAAGYAELTVRRRQTGHDREDLQLAEWFSGRPLGPAEDEIRSRIAMGEQLDHLRFESWRSTEDLQSILLTFLSQELKLQSETDAFHFEISLGGNPVRDYVYFNVGAAERAEEWQILSPVRGMAYGVRGLNRLVQTTFREATIKWAQSKYRKIPSPMGLESIVYGDKVINVGNHFHWNVYPTQDSLKYVANGEIGMVVGQFKYQNFKGMPSAIEVEFSSQLGFKYRYGSQYFKDEASPLLELAYAITVHKAQGSEFGLCFLILPNPCRLLSRELLYTALTRQRERLVILHQGDLANIWQYTSDFYSDTAKRFTNLFSPPKLQLIQGNYMEEKLIHRSVKGEAMRSKSEVIIANLLKAADVPYEYEKVFVGSDGNIRLPDFTIEDAESGVTYYWEHDGMPGNREHNERWKTKLAWYLDQKILPYENGGGDQGTLIVTKDELNGGINTQQIQAIINKIWL